MKRFLSIILVMVFLLAALAAVPAAAEGTETIEIRDGVDRLTLFIQDCGYTKDDRTEYTVTVGGYNVLLTGKSGNLSDLMPFKVAVAWDAETYLTSDTFAVTMDPVTTAIFKKESGDPIEEPKYILIAPKGTGILKGWCYVIDEGQFRPAQEAMPETTARDTVCFGRYPQTEAGTDETPIEWIVLEVKDGKALLISNYALDAMPYNTKNTDVTWETCSLRDWLNGEFLNTAFSPEEQAAIPVTEVDNSTAQGNSEWNTDGGNNTRGKVFLLSYAEANQYFEVTGTDRYNIKARVHPTAYAVSHGAYTTYNYTTRNGSDTGWWWLRSPGFVQHYAARVRNDGSLVSFDVFDVGCVRPALWIDLESEIFKSENPQYGAGPGAGADQSP